MSSERRNHTLQPTALVNEVWLKLLSSTSKEWVDRHHFLAAASKMMRNLLVDYARARKSEQRGGRWRQVEMPDLAANPRAEEILDVDMALTELARIAPRQADLVELRYFGALSAEEAAEALGLSLRTANRDWALARAWLKLRLA